MNEIRIKKTLSDDIRILPFLFASSQEQIIQEGEVWAAFKEDEICGAVGWVKEDNVAEIRSLYVEESCRCKGIGSKLIKEAVNYATLQGNVSISLEYSCTKEQNLNITEFLLKNGFTTPIPGAVLYSVPMNTLENSVFASQKIVFEKMEDKISRFGELPASAWDMGKIPDYMLPNRAPGKLLKELCLTYVNKGKVCAFIVMCDMGNQKLHLHSAFLADSSYGGYLIGLLQKAVIIIKEKYPHFQILTVTGATVEGKKLIERLLQGAQITEKTAYKAEYPLQRNHIFRPEGFYGVMIRFHTLADALAEKEIESKLIVVDGAMPYMELPLGEADASITIEYEVLGGGEYTGFVLKAFYEFMEESESREDGNDWENAMHENVVILEGEEGHCLLYGRYEETPVNDVEKSIEQFIIPFMSCVKKKIGLKHRKEPRV